MYYNTTNESGEKLKEYKKKALTQKQVIMEAMNYAQSALTTKGKMFTTSASVLGTLDAFLKTPITSIRRALTNLVHNGDLMYTGEKRKGLHGRDESMVQLGNKY